MSTTIIKTLGGVDLPAGLQWVQAGHAQGRASVARLDLGGRPWVFSAPALRRMTLQASEDMGWLTTAQVQALHSLATTSADAVLVWQEPASGPSGPSGPSGRTVRVAFDHEQGPAVAATEIVPHCGWWTGTVSLIVLEDY